MFWDLSQSCLMNATTEIATLTNSTLARSPSLQKTSTLASINSGYVVGCALDRLSREISSED